MPKLGYESTETVDKFVVDNKCEIPYAQPVQTPVKYPRSESDRRMTAAKLLDMNVPMDDVFAQGEPTQPAASLNPPDRQ